MGRFSPERWAAGFFVVGALSYAFAAVPDRGDWKGSLRLVVSGGPVAGDVEVLLNGEFVAGIQGGEAPIFQEIDDLLAAGLNRLEVRVGPAADPRKGRDHLRVAIVPVETSRNRTTQTSLPLIEIEVPRDASGTPTCAETGPFWAGPEPAADPSLKERYWLFAFGPPAKVRVTTYLNGMPVHDASAGNDIVEVTRFVKKGKNEVRFESRPTCLVLPSGREGLLEFSVAAAELVEDTVRQKAPAEASFEVDPKRTVRSETVRRTLRGR